MLLATSSTGPFTQQGCGGEILSFPQSLDVQARFLGCCRIPELGFTLQSLFMLLLCVRSQGCRADIISFLVWFVMYWHTLYGVEREQQDL